MVQKLLSVCIICCISLSTVMFSQQVSVQLIGMSKSYKSFQVYSYYPAVYPAYIENISKDRLLFSLTNESKTALYSLYLINENGSSIFQDFIYQPDKNVELSWDVVNNTITFTNNPINLAYQEKLAALEKQYKKSRAIENLLEIYPDKDSFYNQAVLQKTATEDNLKKLYAQYVEDKVYPFLELVFQGINLNRDFNDTYIKQLPIAEESWYGTPRPREIVNSYFSFLKNSNTTNNDAFINKYVTGLLNIFGNKVLGRRFLKDYAFSYWYNADNELLFKEMSDALLAFQEIKEDQDFVHKSEAIAKYRVGQNFPLEEVIQKTDNKEKVLVLMISTHCIHCDELLEQLKSIHKQLTDYSVFMVLTEKSEAMDKEKWEKWKGDKSLNAQWIANDKIAALKSEWAIFGTPGLFVLQKQKESWKIVAKKINF